MNNRWIVRIIVILFSIGLLPIVVNGTAKLISRAIHGLGNSIHSIFRPFSMSGEARLEGFIVILLYSIFILILFRVLFRTNGGGDGKTDG